MNGSTKICAVCGDKAKGRNFGAITCQSCKAFFRRNASNFNFYECLIDEKCQMNTAYRKFCRRCRLKKCFDIGMREDWILNEEQKTFRRNKIEENRNKKYNNHNNDHNSNSTSSLSPESQNSDTNDMLDLDLFDITSIDEEIIEKDFDINSYLFGAENNYTGDDDCCEEDFAVDAIEWPLDEKSDKFNTLECNRLSELFSALAIMQNTVRPESNAHVMNGVKVCDMIMYQVEREVRQLVSVVKRLSAFYELCENDQICLLKYGSVDIFCVRAILSYDLDKNIWTIFLDNNQSIIMHTDLFVEKGEKNSVFVTHINHLKKLSLELESDIHILDLLSAIILFNPDRPNLIHKELIKLQQQIYMYLLQRYLLLKSRSEYHSKERFVRLLNCMHDFEAFSRVRVRPCVKTESIGPFLREILDD